LIFFKSELIPSYSQKCSEQTHYNNIDKLIQHANKIDPGILGKNGYKYGVAQKFFNLSLKYYWCLGIIDEPPHCPIDRIIVGKVMEGVNINWTQILNKSQYEQIIERIKIISKKENISIAIWELINYSRRNGP
jgi:hypothetical protein